MLFDHVITPAYAQGAPAGPFGGDYTSFLMMIAIFAVFYFLLIRPQQKKAKEAKAMLEALQKGDEIVTAGGVLGKISKLGDQYRHDRDRVRNRNHGAAGRGRAAAAQGHDQGAVNRYPLWKYLIIGVALVVGIVYTLPNFFPEVPAVQVSSSKATVKIDNALLGTVEDALKAAAIPYRGAALDATGIKLRFDDPDTQLKAKDALQGKLGDNYIVALNLLSATPRWLTSIGALPMYLGLDLRGGVHFLLQVDMKAALDKAADRYTTDIRSLLREKKVQYSGVAREGNNVAVRFRDEAERNRARIEIEKAFPDLAAARSRRRRRRAPPRRRAQARGAEADPGRRRPAEHHDPAQPRQRARRRRADRPAAGRGSRRRAASRRAGHGAREGHPRPHRHARDPHGQRRRRARSKSALAGQPPLGSDLFTERSGGPVLVRRQVVLTGDRINDAQPGFDQRNNEPAVHVNLDGTGARIFKEVTRENVGKRMAIVLVEKGKAEVITAPVIREEIGGGRVQISGRMNTREANDIALLMRAGALAAPMEIVEERTVGPSLGKENIDKGFNSVFYGFIVLSIFMCAYYLLMGLISTIALSVNLLLLVALLSMLQATLTLARHRGHRAHARHGDRLQRADQRAHPRGVALGRDAARGAHRGLRARVRHDPRLQRDDADRRHRAPDLRHRTGARLRRRPLPRHHDVDVLRGVRLARHRQPDLRRPQAP